jgi:hypothetical protein
MIPTRLRVPGVVTCNGDRGALNRRIFAFRGSVKLTISGEGDE